MLDAAQLRQAGPGADRDQDALGAMRPSPPTSTSCGPITPPARADQLDADALQHVEVDAVEPVDLAIARRDQRAASRARGSPGRQP